MFNEQIEDIKYKNALNKDLHYDKQKKVYQQQAVRFMDMQSVVNAKLAGSQQSVNNAENYPSTWTTNPDGGANGQV